jgi:HK97 family phage major capsid protein
VSTLVEKLGEQRYDCWVKANAIAERAFQEERDLTAEEKRQFDEWDAEMVRLDERRQSLLAGEKRAKAVEDSIAELAGKPVSRELAVRGGDGAATPGFSDEQITAELRRFVNGEIRSFDLPFPSVIERRTLQVSGVAMPTSFIHQLYVYLVDTSSVRQAGATVISTTTGEQILIPYSSAEGAALWTAEGGTLSASDPTLSSATLGAHKVGKLIQVSKELATDVGFDLVGYLAQSAGRNIGVATNSAYVSGTAATQPSGFMANATVAMTGAAGAGGLVGLPTATGGDYGADILVNMYHSIIPQYRPRASWMMNDGVIKVVRKLKDTLGRFIWEPSLQAGVPDTILGKPVYANPAMDLFGANKKPIAFGDFSAYYIRDVTPLRFERSDEFAFGTDLISFRALMRTDGILVDTNAVKLYQCPAT